VPLSVNRLGLCRTHVTAAAAVMLCFSCNYGEVVVVAPAAAGHGPLTISIQADPEDSAVARELGWSRGIPGAEVTVSPGVEDTATGAPIAVLQTDSTGMASVSDLADGHYLVEARRLLTADEASRLSPAQDVIGFAGEAGAQRGRVTVPVPASRRHSVVISEWAFNYGWIASAGLDYEFGGYLELANNSDTTVYLDGLVIGMAYSLAQEYRPGQCAASEGTTNDPDGIWTRYFDSLPGTGRTYPLAPGRTAVIATDAIDHSVIWSGGLDLSHADFEFIGDADVDNPSVPNTIDIGLAPYWFGHGLILAGLSVVAFVALPLDVAALPMTPGHDYARVPRAKILDVVALLSTFPLAYPLCPHLVHSNFDRHRARLMEGYNVGVTYSVTRRVAYTRADGRKILQHTRTAIADFVRGPRTPGWLP